VGRARALGRARLAGPLFLCGVPPPVPPVGASVAFLRPTCVWLMRFVRRCVGTIRARFVWRAPALYSPLHWPASLVARPPSTRPSTSSALLCRLVARGRHGVLQLHRGGAAANSAEHK
jgi:hypothetical protein